MDNSKSICFVVPNAYPLISGDTNEEIIGGAELQAWTIAKELVSQSFEVFFIVISPNEKDITTKIDGVNVISCYRRDEGIKGIRYIYPRWTGLWRALSAANTDCYYQRAAGVATGIVGFYCKIKRKRFIYGVAHDTDLIRGKELIGFYRDKLLYRLGLRLANVVAVQTLKQKRLAEAYRLNNIELLPNIYNESNIGKTSLSKSKFTVLWVSTIREFKDPLKLIELAKLMPDTRFVMIGGKSESEISLYEDVINEAHGIDNLSFMGFLPIKETEVFFDNASVFVNTSVHEGFPNTFLQSWSRSIPTVSFVDVESSCSDSSFHKSVESVHEMKSYIELLKKDCALYEKLCFEANAYYKNNHSSDTVIRRYCGFVLN